jgi:histidinol-phosphate aminotransferase
MFDLKQVTRKNIWSLEPYRCARDDYSEGILLDANENAFGGPVGNLERYPDPHQLEIKRRLAVIRNVDHSQFYIGVGSDECIAMVLTVFCRPGIDKILITPPTYGMYSVCAQIHDSPLVKVPLTLPDFQLDVQSVPLF